MLFHKPEISILLPDSEKDWILKKATRFSRNQFRILRMFSHPRVLEPFTTITLTVTIGGQTQILPMAFPISAGMEKPILEISMITGCC